MSERTPRHNESPEPRKWVFFRWHDLSLYIYRMFTRYSRDGRMSGVKMIDVDPTYLKTSWPDGEIHTWVIGTLPRVQDTEITLDNRSGEEIVSIPIETLTENDISIHTVISEQHVDEQGLIVTVLEKLPPALVDRFDRLAKITGHFWTIED